MAVDRIALSVVARSNPRLQTVDEFSSRMIDDEVFADVEGKCSIEANPTDTNDLQLTLTALADRYSDFCFRKSQVTEKCPLRYIYGYSCNGYLFDLFIM